MAGVQCEAVVLRVLEFGESDRIVHLLTPAWGRVTAIAKGAKRSRKRFAGTLDLFHRLRVQLERRRPTSMVRLEHTRLLDAHEALRVDPRRFALASYLTELLDRLATEGSGGGDAKRVFDAAVATLDGLTFLPSDTSTQVFLELRLLAVLGLRPELARCVRCGEGLGREATLRFHVAEGGPLCGKCGAEVSATLSVQLGTLRALEHSLALPLARLDRLRLGPKTLLEARALVHRFQRFHVGIELRSERVVANMLERPPPAGGVS